LKRDRAIKIQRKESTVLKRCLMLVVLIFLVLGFASPALSGAGDIRAMIDRADALYPERANLDKARAAIKMYEEALAGDPDNMEILWKLSRLYYCPKSAIGFM